MLNQIFAWFDASSVAQWCAVTLALASLVLGAMWRWRR